MQLVEDIVATTEAQLAGRPTRAFDHTRESRALFVLADEMAERPHNVLQKLCELILDVCEAGTAGVSLLKGDGDAADFYWPAVAGAWSPYIGGMMPRSASPCGEVLRHDSVLLFQDVKDIFPATRQATPAITEIMLAPFHQHGVAIGTVWAIAHDGKRCFDREDKRLLTSLARFAAAAHQMTRTFQEARDGEAALRELNHSLEAEVARRTAERDRVWQNSRDMLLILDTNGTIRAVNPAWTTLLGYGADELVGQNYIDFVVPDDHAPSANALEIASREPLPLFENRYRHKDGSIRTISWLAVPEGGLVFAYGRDVTSERKRQAELQLAQEALRQSQKMEAMGQLTGGVAHDFNNLLTPIVGSLDMLQRRGVGSERDKRLIAGAAQSAERARTLVQRLLSFARRQPLQAVSVDVAKLVTGMGDLVSSTSGPQIKVLVEAQDNLPLANADPNQLEMALLNLSVNARDAMPGGGTLRITASEEAIDAAHRSGLKPGIFIRLSVADTGTGMSEATIARATEPFFSTKGIGQGTGLGLSMVHGLASQLGGALTIQSKPGLGTNIELWLPVSTALPVEPEPVRDLTLAAPSLGVALLVDDEELARMSTADMLIDIGYSVIEASSGEDALNLINDGQRFDLLITDHLMPGMTGTDLAHAVRSHKPGVPVLLMSGYAEVAGIEPRLPRLTKPFRRDELVASLTDLSSNVANV